MGDLSARNFGLLIAYLIPGFVALWGLSHVSPAIGVWLTGVGTSGPSVGSAMYVLIASVACGMTASVFRWALLDTIHHRTGLVRPRLDESKLASQLQALDYLVESHYRYYQFYGNTLISMLLAYACWRQSPISTGVGWAAELGVLVIATVFVLGSRDTLAKYYAGSVLLLGTVPDPEEFPNDQRQTPPPSQGSE